MTKQLFGSIAWEYTHKDGHFQGYHYCIGYCPECRAKVVINEEQIEMFNKRSLLKLRIKASWFSNLMFMLKRLKRLRLRLELTESTIEVENKKPKQSNLILKNFEKTFDNHLRI